MAISKNDILIIVPLSILIIFGMIMVTSSSIHVADDISSNPFYFAQRQIIFISIGLISSYFTLNFKIANPIFLI